MRELKQAFMNGALSYMAPAVKQVMRERWTNKLFIEMARAEFKRFYDSKWIELYFFTGKVPISVCLSNLKDIMEVAVTCFLVVVLYM